MAALQRVKDAQVFLAECWEELTKVTWPDRDQLRNATLVVILFTIAISLVIWLMDSVVSFLIRSFMGLFGA
ncbi:MAG: preprotein translocase subunit SecE [Longimicrobiales bacterium]